MPTLPTNSAERKEYPVYSGPLRYFPAAIAAVAKVCKLGNDKHNPGLPLQHDRTKSIDHADCIIRHLIDLSENGGREPTVCKEYTDCGPARDPDQCDLVSWEVLGVPQVAYIAWRALALCQEWIEKHEGAPVAPGATNSDHSRPESTPRLVEAGPCEQCARGVQQVPTPVDQRGDDRAGLHVQKYPFVKRGPHGEYGQERREGPKDRRYFPYPSAVPGQTVPIGRHSAGRRKGDPEEMEFVDGPFVAHPDYLRRGAL